MEPVVTLTLNPTVDFHLEVERLSTSGKSRATTRRTSAGGGGINVARAVRELGGSATAVFAAGGAMGQLLCDLLDDEPFEVVKVDISGDTRMAVVLIEQESGHSYHVVPQGPALSGQEADNLFSAVQNEMGTERCVVISGSPPEGIHGDFFAEIARVANSQGARLFVDTSGIASQQVFDEGMYLLRLNHREAGEMIGTEITDFDDARRANEQLIDQGAVQVMLTTLGELGALCSTESGHIEIHTPTRPQPARGDAGAGDSLMAGITVGVSRGDSIVDACRLGVAAAAASVSSPDTMPGTAQEVEALLADVEAVAHQST